ncbi:MAG: membrane protein insertase YidC [Oscillospiraceae bacterium]|nr:membrane protein insertase YidC [Oscillospiraceae bacterium]
MFDMIALPFGRLLMFLYNMVNNYALALLLVAVVVKVILLPFQMKAKRGQLRQARLQPKMAELQKKHAANKQKLNEEMAKLYKEEGINPASGCLWSFIQMPIMIALFFAIRQPLTLMMGVARDLLSPGGDGEAAGAIYQKLQEMGFNFENARPGMEQIEQAEFITAHFDVFAPLSEHLQRISFSLGNINFALTPDWQVWNFDWSNAAVLMPALVLFMFPILSGGAQFLSMGIMRKMNVAGTPEAAAGTMGKVMKFMPLMSVWFGFILPAALSFYWTIGTILQIGQDVWLTKKYTKIIDAEEAEKNELRKAREAEIEAKREETERKKAEGLVERNRNTSRRKKQKSDKQGQLEKAVEWEKKNAPALPVKEKDDPGRIDNRRYARGRAYDPDRFANESSEASVDDSDEGTDEFYGIADEQGDDTVQLFTEDDDEENIAESADNEDEQPESDEDSNSEDDEDDESEAKSEAEHMEEINDNQDDKEPETPQSEKFDTKRFD